ERSARLDARRGRRRRSGRTVAWRRGRETARARHRRPVVPAAGPADVGHRRLSLVHRPEGLSAPGAGSSGDGLAGCRSDDPGLRVDAVVLAGGRAARLGGADKPALVMGDRSLLASVVSAAVAAGARLVIVVGPPRPGLVLAAGQLRVVREEPP